MNIVSTIVLVIIIVVVLFLLYFVVMKLLKGCLIRAAIGLVVLAALAYFAYRYFIK